MRSAVLALIAATVLPASAAAGTSRAVNWVIPGQKVVCGVAEQVPGTAVDPGTMAPQNGRWPGLQCSAVGIPRPRQGIGDPFVRTTSVRCTNSVGHGFTMSPGHAHLF